MSESFFVKGGYTPNAKRTTFEEEGTVYWTEGKIAKAGSYQYYVYELARALIRQHGYKSVMDVGCGPATKVGNLISPVCDDIVLVDQPSMTTYLGEHFPTCRFIPVDLEELDGVEAGRSFDLIICSDVVEHLFNPNPCVGFLHRHLAPGGLAIISTPERDYRRGKACMNSPNQWHVREWNSAEFARYLTSRGFQVVEHHLMPTARVSKLQWVVRRWGRPLVGMRRRWRKKLLSCQTTVCKKA